MIFLRFFFFVVAQRGGKFLLNFWQSRVRNEYELNLLLMLIMLLLFERLRRGTAGRAGAGVENAADPVETLLPGRQGEQARPFHQSSRGRYIYIYA